MSDDHFGDRVKEHGLYFGARQQVNGYYEKLALLDGATVSLVVTAALGKFLGVLRHKYTLGVALTFLVAAMLALLYRNQLATQVEHPEAQLTAYPTSEDRQRKQLRSLYPRISYYQWLGVVLSVVGIVLLLAEVWLVLVGH
jgi:deoxyinosine 3'endonuclease (endonuclease V)